MKELWCRVGLLPDLGLHKYASLDGSGVDGVLEKHIAFLRQWNRKGVLTGVSLHLFYMYICPDDKSLDRQGRRLEVLLLIRGDETAMENVPSMIEASPLSDFYEFEAIKPLGNSEDEDKGGIDYIFSIDWKIPAPQFSVCSILTKTETLLPAGGGEADDYYMIREWEMNEDGRLYNMCKLMEALNQTALFRVDLYPVERSLTLRDAFRKPISILRKRQDERLTGSQRDYEGKDVLGRYEKIMEQFESSPHFIANIMVFANRREDSAAILDAAGSEALLKGKYSIATFNSNSEFNVMSYLGEKSVGLESMRDNMVLRSGKAGLIVCREDTANLNLNYLPTLFSLEEITPFFRFPALYEGEVIQKPKETAPPAVIGKDALYLGKDENSYDVFFKLDKLPKHAFISGVPGSGKTNTMLHIVSSLWKEHKIPFLILEPAKQEYRALANDPDMKDLYIFSPNADMSFPLHINPFEMPIGVKVGEHIRSLCSVFEGAFPLENPMPFLLDTAIEAVYRELGWIPEHEFTGEEKTEDGLNRKHLPTMSMLYKRIEEELKSTRYSEEVRGNLESALQVRMGSLLVREMGDIFDVPESTIPPEKWLDIPAVIELEALGKGPANFLTLMICSLIRSTLRVKPNCIRSVRHVLLLEEAHNLIGPESEEQTGVDANPKQAATAFLIKMLAEVRALNESIIIADQLPTVMAQEVIKNTGLKIGLRITSADDRSLLGSTMAASGMQLEQMATFSPGESLVFYEDLMRPFRMRMKEWWGELPIGLEKENMVKSHRDNALRELLSDRETYKSINERSITIIGKKFNRLLEDIKKSFEPQAVWLEEMRKLNKTMVEMSIIVNQIYSGTKSVTQETKEKYDADLVTLVTKFISKVNDKRKIGAIIDYIEQSCHWAFTLDRLKRSRWNRFNSLNEKMHIISQLQIEIIRFAINAYQSLESFYNISEYDRKLVEDVSNLEKLYHTLEQCVFGDSPK